MIDVNIPEQAWTLLSEFPSPEDIDRAARLIAAAELDRTAPDLNCGDDYELLGERARELRGEV